MECTTRTTRHQSKSISLSLSDQPWTSDRMPGSAHASFAMSALLMAGGGAGYARAKSLPSLIAGVTFSGAFLLSGYWIQSGEDYKGHRLGLSASTLLSGAMLARAVKTRKPLPTGVAAIALLSAGYHGKKTVDWAPDYVSGLIADEDEAEANAEPMLTPTQRRAQALQNDIDALRRK